MYVATADKHQAATKGHVVVMQSGVTNILMVYRTSAYGLACCLLHMHIIISHMILYTAHLLAAPKASARPAPPAPNTTTVLPLSGDGAPATSAPPTKERSIAPMAACQSVL